jgi:hypothetical protein
MGTDTSVALDARPQESLSIVSHGTQFPEPLVDGQLHARAPTPIKQTYERVEPVLLVETRQHARECPMQQERHAHGGRTEPIAIQRYGSEAAAAPEVRAIRDPDDRETFEFRGVRQILA